MRTTLLKNVLFLGVVASLVSSNASQAAVSEVAGGFALPTPLGNYDQVLNRPTGYQLEMFYDNVGLGPSVDLHLQIQMLPYMVQNALSSSLTQYNGFVGVAARGGKMIFGVIPFFALDIGFDYDALTYSGFPNTSGNSGGSFATQAVPGLDIPVAAGFGVIIELPIQFVFVKNTFASWNSVFSLRYDL
jgi:hypothetical protein